ncbi:MAG: Bug family tripartite tricarboxylate transporter substrate binding protein [Burkholderiales bacterium]
MTRLALAILLVGICITSSPLRAQDYPLRPIRMIVGVPPGGTTDIMGRIVAAKLTERLGRQVVVDNRTGASGIIAIQLVASSQPDGYTLLISGSSITAVGSLYPNVRFDVSRDLVPVAFIATTPFMLVVHPGLPVTSVNELISYVKSRPEGLHYAGSAPGTVQHLSGELLKRMTGMNLTYVPYKGTGAVMPDLLSGRLQAAIENVVTMRPHIRSGALRGLGVTSSARSAVIPELPTIAEAGVPGFQAVGRFAVFASSKTPRPIVDRLNREIATFMKEPESRERLLAQGAEPVSGRPDELRVQVDREIAQWAKVIREAGLKME